MKNDRAFEDKRLLGVLDGVDGKFIAEAIESYDLADPQKTRKAPIYRRVALLAACLLSDGFSMPQSFLGWLLCVAFALAINVGAVVLFQNGAFLIGGQKASILSTVEPITSLLIGFAFLNERLGALSIIGSVLIISASVLISVFDIATPNVYLCKQSPSVCHFRNLKFYILKTQIAWEAVLIASQAS